MLCDCHVHTNFSTDSETDPEQQLARAAALRMPELCITDHEDYDAVSVGDGERLTFLLDFDSYLNFMEDLRRKWADRIRLNLGVEFGLQMRIRDFAEEFREKYWDRFDYVIGSSHFIDGLDVYYPAYFLLNPDPDRRAAERERYRHYFEKTLERVRSFDCFDALGHLDFVIRYGPFKNRYYDLKTYGDLIDPILLELIRKDKALEVNTGGYKYGMGEPNPGWDIIRRYRALGGSLITIGSDAHVPGYVGYEFEKTASLLKECGFHEYAVYHRHEPVLMPL